MGKVITLEGKEVELEREYGCTDRIARIREKIVNARPHLSSERAKIVTEAYKKYESEPIVIKRAKSLEEILKNITVWILDEELIAGHMTEYHRSAPAFPEMGIFWLRDELDEFETREQDRFVVSDSVKKDLLDMFPFWENKTLYDCMMSRMPAETKKQLFMKNPVINAQIHLSNGLGHICQDFEKVVKIGFAGIKKEAEDKMRRIDLAEPGMVAKYNFLRAILIVCDAAVLFANRYADEAEKQAQQQKDEQRKAELLKMAEICRKVPEHPATTFWEALQAIWFVQLITQIETDGVSISPGRLDQYVYPMYLYSKKNRIDGNLQELFESFWMKFTEMVKIYDTVDASFMASFPMGQHVIAGGIDENGRDVTNEMSYMMLNAQLHIRLPQPNFGVRVHSCTPPEFLHATAETIRDANSMPQIDNDEVYIPALMERGVPMKQARNYCLEGCNEPGIPGKLAGRGNGGFFNQTKCLELALNDGKCMLSGEQMGPHTGEIESLKTFEDVKEAYRKQLAFFTRENTIIQNTIDAVHAEVMPTPFVSSTMDVIEVAEDVTAGGCEYNLTGPIVVGIGTTGNALAAIKRLVFDDRKIALGDLTQAMKNNFEGYESVRKMALQVPKWGNDVEYVDDLTCEAINMWNDELRKQTNERGGEYYGSCLPVTAVLAHGRNVAATADGRLAREGLSDSIGAQPGTDLCGPTAAINSVCQLNHIEMGNGLIFNMRIDPDSIAGEKIRAFESLIRAFIRMKGTEMQFNIVNSKTLRKAQGDPAKYRGLTVRVAGYSALFVDLSKTVQEDIIKRTAHKF